jgi:outer membrane protein TolC
MKPTTRIDLAMEASMIVSGSWSRRRARRGVRCAAVALALAAASALVSGSTAQPETAARLTLLDAAQRAQESHPLIAASSAARDEAGASIREAQAAWWPGLRVSGTATRYEEPMATLPIHGFTGFMLGDFPPFDRTLYQGVASLSYTLFDGNARVGRVRQARSRAGAADAALDATEQGVLSRVVVSYLGVLGTAQVLEAHDQHLAALQAERTRVGQRLDAGRAAPLEALRVDAELANAEADRVRFAFALEQTQLDLARLVGVPVDAVDPARLQAVACVDTTLAAREPLLAQALTSSAALRQAREQRVAADAGRCVARSARWPELKAVGTYIEYADASDHDTGEWNAGLQLSMNLFTGGAIRAGVARADAAARGAGEQVRVAEMQVGQDLDRARAAVAESHARVLSLEKAVASLAEVVRIERVALTTGSGTQTDYLRAEADLLTARANRVEARHREIAARVELARVTGQLDMAWLARNLGAAE